jgi:hypothetical protein
MDDPRCICNHRKSAHIPFENKEYCIGDWASGEMGGPVVYAPMEKCYCEKFEEKTSCELEKRITQRLSKLCN